MNTRNQIELVDQHAEALLQGRGLSFELHEQDADTRQLLTVAGRVKSALRPVAPRAEFVRDLKQRLAAEVGQQQAERREHRLMLVASLGGLVYGLGVLALGFRTSIWVFGLVAMALGWNKRQAAPAVAKATS